MIYLFSSQLNLGVDDIALISYYEHTLLVPEATTIATIKENYNGLILDDVFSSHGGRAVLIRVFFLISPTDQCIIGPIERIILRRHFQDEKIAIIMPFLLCPLSTIPILVSDAIIQSTIKSLMKSLNFIHSKNIIHGDIKSSNLM